MDFLFWFCLPIAVAVGSSLLTYALMRDKLTIAVERERQLAREARVLLDAQQETVASRVTAAEERVRRQWMEELLAGRIPGVPNVTVRSEPRVLEPSLLGARLIE